MFSVDIVGDAAKWLKQKNSEMQKTMQGKVKKATLQVEQETKANLRPHVSSGALIRSYSSNFAGSGFDTTGQVGTNLNYAPAVEKGSKRHWPPIGPLKRWAAQRGLNPYAVQRSIAAKGTKAHPHLEPAAKDVLTGFDWSL